MNRFFLALAALVSLVTSAPAPREAHASRQMGPGHARIPNLGWMTVRPKRVHVDDSVTISGRTHGSVMFLPPYVVMASTRTHTVTFRKSYFCPRTAVEPRVAAVVDAGGGGAGAPGSRKQPPAGTPWSVTFRVPRRMTHLTGDGRVVSVPTPAGVYRLVALGVGIGVCFGLPSGGTAQLERNGNASVATLTVVR